jgi:SAM-dependent methyltransferase
MLTQTRAIVSSESELPETRTNYDYTNVCGYYQARDADGAYERDWGYGNPLAAAYWRMRDELVFPRVARRRNHCAALPRVLEIGCGYGHELAKMSLLGIPQGYLTGVDLVEHRISGAKALYPGIRFEVQDATQLEFEPASFDIVTQFTCFMHAPTAEMHRAMCAEVARVLKPGGIIIWWDLAPSTRNASRALQIRRLLSLRTGWARVKRALQRPAPSGAGANCHKDGPRRISPSDLPRLFPGFDVQAQHAGLSFESWKSLWPKSPGTAEFLWRSGVFAEHCFAVICKKS